MPEKPFDQPTSDVHWADGGVTGGVSEPTEAKKDNGYNFKEKPSHEQFNWLLRELASRVTWATGDGTAEGAIIRRFSTLEEGIAATVPGELFYVETGEIPEGADAFIGDEILLPSDITDLATDGELIIAAAGNIVYALNPGGLSTVWTRDLGAAVVCVDVEGDDVAAYAGGTMYRLARADGTTVHSAAPVTGPVGANLKIDSANDHIYWLTSNALQFDFWSAFGADVPRKTFGAGATPNDFVILGEYAYVATGRETAPATNKVLWAIDLNTGAEVWSDTDITFGSLSVASDGVRVYRGNADAANGIRLYRADDGTILSSRSSFPSFSAVDVLAVDQDRLYGMWNALNTDVYAMGKHEIDVTNQTQRVFRGFPFIAPNQIIKIVTDGVRLIVGMDRFAPANPQIKVYDTRRAVVLMQRVADGELERTPFYNLAVPVRRDY
jgi:hypothetical protein